MNPLWALGEFVVLGGVFGAVARACSLQARRPLAVTPTSAAACAAGGALSFLLAAGGAAGWRIGGILACAAVSAVTDVQTGYVFDRVLALSAIVIGGAAIAAGSWEAAVWGAAAAGIVAWLPYACSNGRAMGFGDVKFAAVLGAGLGCTGAAIALWVAFVTGGAAAVLLLLCGRVERKAHLPFAPFLALGACCALVHAA
jgi:prepilin signal peptidase PulO-like enzyme (type II secretory pathway)